MIIGLTGTIGSGKSTVAKHLESAHGFTRINFKDALLIEVKERFPLLLAEINSYYRYTDTNDLMNAVSRPPLLRALLQNYGTEVRRVDNPDYWAHQWEKAVVAYGGNVVADDVRFVNEADTVEALGGVIFRVNGVTPSGSGHASETEQSKIIVEETIYNHWGLPELHTNIDRALERLNGDRP